MAYDIGPRIGIEGEAEFKKQLRAVNDNIKTLGTEMKAVTSAFIGSEDSLEAYAAKSQVLNKQVKAQEEALELLKNQLNKAKDAYGETDTRTTRLQRSVNDATARLNKMKAEVKNTENAMENFGEEVEDAGEELEGAGKKWLSFTDIVKANVIADFAVDGIRELGEALKGLVTDSVSAAADMKAANSQFVQTFGELENEASSTLMKMGDELGIMNKRLEGSATSIYAFARASGASTSEAMAMMEKSLRVAADSAAYYDTSLEDAAETLQSFLKGNYENDAALGLSATEATRDAAAMEQLGQKFKDLTEIQKQQVLLQMVSDAQALSGAVGQAARESDSLTNLAENIKSNWNLILSELGAPIVEGIVPALKTVSDSLYFLLSDADTDQIIDFFKTLGNDLLGLVDTLGDSWIANRLSNMAQGLGLALLQGITETLPKVRTMAVGLVLNFAKYIEENLPVILETGLETISMLAKGFRENTGMIINAAISLALALAQGLADSLPAIIETVPEIISSIANTINDNAPKIFAAAVQIIGTLISGLIQSIPTLIENIPAIIAAIWDTLMAVNWINLGTTIVQGVGAGIKGMAGYAKTSMGTVKKAVTDSLKELPKKMLEIGKELVRGIADGIKNMGGWLKEQIAKFAGGIVSSVQTVFDINSPSGVMRDEVGKYLAQGIGEGFTGEIGRVSQNMQSAVDGLVTAPNGAAAGGYSGMSADVMAQAVKQALNGAGVYLNGKTVGEIITTAQNNTARARGMSPAFG